MDFQGVRKAYQVLTQVILRDFKLNLKIKPLTGNKSPHLKQGKLPPLNPDPLPSFLQSKKRKT